MNAVRLQPVPLPEAKPAKAKPTPIVGTPMQLTPIAWGQPDEKLSELLLQHVIDATPAIVVRFNPFTDRRVRAFLRSCRIAH